MLSEAVWARTEAPVLRTLGLDTTSGVYLEALTTELDRAYQRAVAAFNENTALSIETGCARDRAHLSHLDEDPEPQSTTQLRGLLTSLLPFVDLPEILLEIIRWCGFTDCFVLLNGRRPHIRDLDISICAAFLATRPQR